MIEAGVSRNLNLQKECFCLSIFKTAKAALFVICEGVDGSK